MGRHNNREKKNTYQTEIQQEKELDKLRRELIKPSKKYYGNKPKFGKKKFDKNQK